MTYPKKEIGGHELKAETQIQKAWEGSDDHFPAATKMVTQIRKAWKEYHGPIVEEDGERYIPTLPPIYRRGYLDGYAAAQVENAAGRKKSSVERCEYSDKRLG
jgi:hypothetical protein